MGPMHDVDYFAESIINPSAVIEKGKGYAAADGSYKMPSFNDSMTVQELVDLIAFFTSDGEVLFGKKQDGDGRKH